MASAGSRADNSSRTSDSRSAKRSTLGFSAAMGTHMSFNDNTVSISLRKPSGPKWS